MIFFGFMGGGETWYKYWRCECERDGEYVCVCGKKTVNKPAKSMKKRFFTWHTYMNHAYTGSRGVVYALVSFTFKKEMNEG